MAKMVSKGSHYLKPQVVDRIPMLTAKQTEEIRSQLARKAFAGKLADGAAEGAPAERLMERFNSLTGDKLLVVSAAAKVYEDMAAEADVDSLVITHQSPNLCRPGSSEKAIADIASIFKGELIFGKEFLTLDLT